MTKIPSISENFSEWYLEAIKLADLADYGPVKGTMIIKPYGYSLWKTVQNVLGKMITDSGTEDAYFPLFIPYSFLAAEKEHVEGFAPELALVTKAGGEDLDEPLVVRPTSETIMYKSFSQWIQSYRDLPLKINQWCNIVRWEKRTMPFMRTSEFLWQEGHTAHTTEIEAVEEVMSALQRYYDFARTYMAIPALRGRKTIGEKFAGADFTTCLEVMVKSKKALQFCTSHLLGQNFAKVFDVSFVNEHNQKEFVWQTSWGFSTRTIGAMIGVHGDDKGLVLPPLMAPIQVIIIPIYKDIEVGKKLKVKIDGIEKNLNAHEIRVKSDWSDNSLGWKFNNWEVKGVPIRIEIGEKEMASNEYRIVLRHTGMVKSISQDQKIEEVLGELIKEIQAEMYQSAERFMQEHTVTVTSESQLASAVEEEVGFIKMFFKDTKEKAKEIQEKYKITPRVIPFETEDERGPDIFTGEEGQFTVFAKAY